MGEIARRSNRRTIWWWWPEQVWMHTAATHCTVVQRSRSSR